MLQEIILKFQSPRRSLLRVSGHNGSAPTKSQPQQCPNISRDCRHKKPLNYSVIVRW